MTCRDVIEFLADYLEDRVSADERRVFDEHLAECPPCVAYLHSYQQTIDLSRDALSSGSAGEVPDELVHAVLAARGG